MFREATRRARLPHTCDKCREWIPTGESHLVRTELYGNATQTWRLHLGCVAAYDEGCKTVLEKMFSFETDAKEAK